MDRGLVPRKVKICEGFLGIPSLLSADNSVLYVK